MMVQVVEVGLRGGTRLYLRFDDGAEGEVDIADVVPFDGVFARLRDRAEFEKVRLDSEWGTICWPGGLDLAPEPLHQLVTGKDPLAAPSPALR